MGVRFRPRGRGLVLMSNVQCFGCGRIFDLFGDSAWMALKRRLGARPVYCDSCADRIASRSS
jgi:uncharacterized protein YlaI